LVGWEINVQFQHKDGQRYSNLPASLAFLFSDDPKRERIGEAHLSYYVSTYNREKTNQPAQDLFISSM